MAENSEFLMATVKIKKKNINLFLGAIVIFIVTRQVPFSNYSVIANLALFVLGIVNLPPKSRLGREHVYIFLWTLTLLGIALINDNTITLIIRFYLIILLIVFYHYIVLDRRILKVLFFFVGIQCIFIILIELILLFFFNSSSYLPIRHFVNERNFGDLYTYSGLFYFVQFKGNALIPFCYMLAFVYPIRKKCHKILLKILFLLGTLFAGNFAFYIAIFGFHFTRFISRDITSPKSILKKIIVISFLGVLIAPMAYEYILGTLERKRVDSLGTRSDQVNLLISDLCDRPESLIFGKGIGNTLEIITLYRDYRGMVYYELQLVYFLNQLGIINFLIFIAILIYLSVKKIKYKNLLVVYFFYIVYACTNPYILDTNHIVVILSLIALSKLYEEEKDLTTVIRNS